MQKKRRSPRLYGVLTLALASLAACAPSPPAAPSPAPSPAPGPAPTATPAAASLPHAVIPAPADMRLSGGEPFTITNTTTIRVAGGSPEAARVAEQLAALLRPPTGFPLEIATGGPAAGSISLALGGDASLGEEGYRLESTRDGVTLVANRPAGLFYGVQTLRQLLPPAVEAELTVRRAAWTVPAAVITDRPRFAWRGSMLDVSRHFFSVAEVKQHIDALALYKLNTLHLHLADDQGWRIEIRSHPRLTEVGGATQVGGGPGGFYTQAEYSEIVRYAQERFITIIPEIDTPAHTNALLVVYPQLSCSRTPPAPYTGTAVGFSAVCPDNPETYRVLDDVVRELAAITPGPYIHMGGDEVEMLNDEQYAGFMERMQEMVNRHGKRLVGWQEIGLARLNPTSVGQVWKSDSAEVARAAAGVVRSGAKLLLSPANKIYVDMKYDPSTEIGLAWAAHVPVPDAYNWDPATFMPAVIREADVVGVEAPLWTETVKNLTAAQYLLFPRLPGVAEIGWTPASGRRWEEYRHRLAAHAPRWHYLGINYYRAPEVPWAAGSR